MRYRNVTTILLLTLGVGLSGCYQSTDVSMHKPGVYEGRPDPLIALEGTPAQQKKLQQRFKLVQTDR